MKGILERFWRHKINLGFALLGVTILYYIITSFCVNNPNVFEWENLLACILAISLFLCIVLIFDFNRILFDPREQKPNQDTKDLIRQIRFRGILYNNISIIIFLLTITVICLGFYLLVNPDIGYSGDDKISIQESLTIRISASVLLIFLVQILFKVFKYLLRVAAFYNAISDGLELIDMNHKNDLKMTELVNLLAPLNYDISDLQQVSIFDGIIKAMKGNA